MGHFFHSYRLVDAFVPSRSRNEQSSHPLSMQTLLLRGNRKRYNLHRDARELPSSKRCKHPRRNIGEPLQEERAQKSRGLGILQHTHFGKIPAFKASRSPVTKHKPASRSQQLPLQALRLLQTQSKQKTLTTQIFPQALNQTPPFLQVSALLSAGEFSAASRDGPSWKSAPKYLHAQHSFLHTGKTDR